MAPVEPVDSLRVLGEGAPVSWEQRLLDLFEDLEQQAEGAALAARDVEVSELARAEYAEVELASRWHASLGRQVEVTGPHGLLLRGRVARTGHGWCLVTGGDGSGADAQEWLVALDHVAAVRGLSSQAQPPALRPVTGRLGLGSALRGVAEERQPVLVVRADGARRVGRLVRVGKDFLELAAEEGGVELVPFSVVAAVRR